jgi:predicted Fe-Mo cluster-binding NifX family protein
MNETIAITNWNDIVSPLYDASCCLVIVRPGGAREVVDVRKLSLIDKADLCAREGVEVVICGAISKPGSAMLVDKGITVHSWIRGPVDEVIAAFRNKVDLRTSYAMPGCGAPLCRKRRHSRGTGRRCARPAVREPSAKGA